MWREFWMYLKNYIAMRQKPERRRRRNLLVDKKIRRYSQTNVENRPSLDEFKFTREWRPEENEK